MYWFYLLIFIVAILAPDIIQWDLYFLPEKRAEELLIFLLGTTGFLFFVWQERQLSRQKQEKLKDQKKINQTVKDLVESYSYIGEVNRKMDILMNVALGLTEKSNFSKKKETEIYHTIIDAAKFLMKADCACLKFVNIKAGTVEKDVHTEQYPCPLNNKDLIGIKDGIGTKKIGKIFLVSSHQKIRNIRCYLAVNDYAEQEEKTIEMLKVLASQALFVFSYAGHLLD